LDFTCRFTGRMVQRSRWKCAFNFANCLKAQACLSVIPNIRQSSAFLAVKRIATT
jgi:hypothetical protein